MDAKASLAQIGLKDKEVSTYLTLLEHGRLKPAEIATLTKINRATVYNILQSLVSRGIIAEDISGTTRYFTSLPPENLINLTREAKREIEEKEALITEAVNEIALLRAEHTYPVPKMRLIEESNLEKFLFDNTTRWQDAIIAGDGVWWGFQDKKFALKYQKWIDFTWTTDQSTHLNYIPKVFTNTSETELELAKKYAKSGRTAKILSDIELTANMWVCGDYLVMIVVDQKPNYLIEIHDAMMAKNIKGIFKKLWSVS